MAIALMAAMTNWVLVVYTDVKFRKRIGPEGAAKLAYRMPGAPWTNYATLAFLGFCREAIRRRVRSLLVRSRKREDED